MKIRLTVILASALLVVIVIVSFSLFRISHSEAAKPLVVAENQSPSPTPLATLQNSDLGYTVSYPANFNAIYAQDGVEFTPKNGLGQVLLSVKDSVASVTIEASGSAQTQLSLLQSAADTIKSSFKYTGDVNKVGAKSYKDRFANFNPKGNY